MTFKDALEADMVTFLNAEEFADMVTLQGKRVLVVLSKDSEQALAEWRKRVHEPPGLNVQLLTVTVAVSDMARPYADDVVDLDGLQWTVLSAAEECGARTVHLYRHES